MTIVFIDDQEDIRELFSMLLEESLPVASVTSFSNISDAKGYIDDHAKEISLIVSDYQLKGENGLKLYSLIKDYNIPFFLMTGMSFKVENEAFEYFKMGKNNRLISKPINEEELIKEINSVL